jgi:flagellar biogenesis protein FliO
MVLYGRLSLLILLAVSILCLPVYGQDATSDSPPPPDDQPVLESVSDTGGAELPEDFPTREAYQAADTNAQVGPSMTDYFRIFIGLGVVIFIIWGLSLLLKRFVQVRGLASSTESLKVLYTMSLTPTRTLYMVRLGERILLIGAGDGGMRTLAEITEPDEVSIILRDLEFKGNFDLNPFRSRLNSLMDSEPESMQDEDLNVRQRKLRGILDKLKTPSDQDEF